MSQIPFPLFLSLWNRAQGLSTPDVHFKIADWLERCWVSGKTRLLLMAFRSCGKSTLVGLFAAWLLYGKPDLRILVLAADALLARKMVRNVKRIIERHPLTRHLKPGRLDQWGNERFTVNRTLELRDPSMLARGISANMTGSRADVILCDDVEVPRTCDSADKREDLRNRLAEIDFILTPGGTQLYIGTPHTWYTIYAEEPRMEIGENRAFLDGFERLKVPVLKNGVSAWPERFPLDEIERIKTRSGPNRFQSQMLLEPVNIAEGRLDPSALQFYDEMPVYSPELRKLFLGDKQILSCSAWWDPAFGRNGDGSVLAILYGEGSGAYWLQHVAYLKLDPHSDEDEATQQCRIVADLCARFYVPSVTVEINGIGRFLPGLLRKAMVRQKTPCAVIEHSSRRNKDERILEAFDAVLAARAMHVHKSVRHTPFIMEMQEWQPGKTGRDDGLDAVAGALSLQPIRLKPGGYVGRQKWY